MKHNKTCIVCGTKYQYCPNCSEYAHLAPWHNLYHDENCREIFHIVTEYLQQKITKADAKERLLKCDYSAPEYFKSSIVCAINEILQEARIEEEVKEEPETFIVIFPEEPETKPVKVEEDVLSVPKRMTKRKTVHEKEELVE